MSNTPTLSRFFWCTLWFDSHGFASCTNRLPAWRIDSRGNDSCRFNRIESNQQHFQPTLHSPPEVKIREIMIHELKRTHKLQSICTICVESIESSRIDNIFNPTSKPRSHANRLPACRIDRRGNDSCWFDGTGFSNRFPVCRIANTKDESTLVGCIGQPPVTSFKFWKFTLSEKRSDELACTKLQMHRHRK